MSDLDILRNNSDAVFEPSGYSDEGRKRAMVFVPDLSLNGAQTVMFELLGLLMEMDYAVTFVSSEDGEYRAKYTDIGARVVIRSHVSCHESFKEYMRSSYDLIFINSSSCIPYLYFFINTQVKVLLWLHESEQQLTNTATMLPQPQLLSPNITILGVTNRVRDGIKNLYNYDVEVMPMPIREEGRNVARDDGKVMFFIPGAYTYIKGQDVLLTAVSKLPGEFRDSSEFIFCGYTLESQMDYYEKVRQMAEKLDNVTMLGALDRGEVYDYYGRCDCVVAPSRIDSTPTSIVEAMMFKKLVLVSSGAGISEYLSDCRSGFVYRSEDELFQRLLLIISDHAKLGAVAEAGYGVYRDFFSPEHVKEILAKVLDG